MWADGQHARAAWFNLIRGRDVLCQAGRSLAERQDLETCPGRSGLGMPFGAGRHGTGEGAGENRRLRTLARRMDVADTMQRGDK